MSRFIPEDIINRVRDSIDIVDLISRHLSLKKAGANYKALCPFHKEKTPSFIVSPARQTFHCFGCGKGGNVFHFLMAIDRISFPEAVRLLARDAGIEIPEAPEARPDEASRAENSRLYEANRRAADFFARMLRTSAGAAAREYVRRRGIADEMVERCCLGYAPDSWDALLVAAAAADVPAALLVRAGLAIAREDGSGYYDRFRNRLMFPIFDTQDRVIGFGARAMGDNEVKYLNTPETPLFSKGRNLYGLNWARRAIVETKRVAVVEGYTDVIMAHQHGCEAVVATLGTALTREHVRLLRRFAERIDVVFDSDPAGQQAAERSMEVFLAEGAGEFVAAGFDVRIAAIEGGKDPCDLIAEHGPEPFQKAIDSAVDVYTKKIELAAQRTDIDTVEGKSRAIDDVLGLIATIPNEVGRQLQVNAALRMLGDTFDVDDTFLLARLAQVERRRRSTRSDEAPTRPPTAPDLAEWGIIESIIAAPTTAARIFAELRDDDFQQPGLRQLFAAAKSLYEEGGTVNPSRLLAGMEDPGIVHSAARPGIEAAAEDCLRELRRRRAKAAIRLLKKEIQRAHDAGDKQLADDLSSQYLKLQREVQTL